MGDEEFQPLTHSILSECLSKIELVVGGGGFAFTRLDCSNKELTNLGNKLGNEGNHKQLREVVLSGNKLPDLVAVMQLPNLLTLKADSNQINNLEGIESACLPYLTSFDISSNQLTVLPALQNLERLEYAYFQGNQIASIDGFGGHPSLIHLELQEQQGGETPFTSLQGFGLMASLKYLNLSGNQLTSLEGLDAPCLTQFNVSKNQLTKLDHLRGAPECIELDVQENAIGGEEGASEEELLRNMSAQTPKLQKLMVSGNPFAGSLGDNVKNMVIMCAPHVASIDGEDLTDEDRQAAKDFEEERRAEAEAAAAQAAAEAEAAAKEAAEAEAAAAAEQAEGEADAAQ